MGVPVGAGTDATRVASYNPWIALYWLVTGKTVGGRASIRRATGLTAWTRCGSIPWKVLLIGVGEESLLTLGHLRLAGTIAAREAVRLGVSHVSFAPTLRDQGSNRIDVGEGDAAVVESFLLAYDTERRLHEQGLASGANIREFVIEAGPHYFAGTVEKVSAAVRSAGAALAQRETKPYRRTHAK